MSLTPYNTNILQALKWLQNKAPNITSLITQKANWYSTYQTQFWQQWTTNVFVLSTANNFGILIWCIILGVPTQVFGLDATTLAWAYGDSRQNYKYSGSPPAPPGENALGGNFAAGGQTTILNLQEARWALLLRYVALVSNGRISFVNKMLNFIFNNGAPWDFATGNYFYVADSTLAGVPASNLIIYENGVLVPSADYTVHASVGGISFTSPPGAGVALTYTGSWNSGTATTPQAFGTGNGTTTNFILTPPPGAAVPLAGAFKIEYRIGPSMDFSSQFVNLLNSPEFGILPTFAGSQITAIVETH